MPTYEYRCQTCDINFEHFVMGEGVISKCSIGDRESNCHTNSGGFLKFWKCVVCARRDPGNWYIAAGRDHRSMGAIPT